MQGVILIFKIAPCLTYIQKSLRFLNSTGENETTPQNTSVVRPPFLQTD